MKVLDVKSGQEREVSAAEAAAGYQAGAYRLQEGAAIPMRTAHGSLVTVAPQDLATASREGFSLASEQEWQAADREARYSTPGQIAATAAEGVGRGLTLGFYDAAAGAIAGRDYAQEAAARAEANPGTAIVGELTGAIAPMLLTSGGAATVGVAPRLAAGMGRAAEAGAARLVGSGARSLAGRALQRGVAGAAGASAEALPSAIGHQVSRAYVENRDLVSEQVLAGIGLETLVGGMAGGILSAGTPAVDDVVAAAKRAFGEAAPGLEKLAAEGAPELENLLLSGAAMATGKRVEDLAGAWRGRAAIGLPDVAADDIATKIDSATRAINDASPLLVSDAGKRAIGAVRALESKGVLAHGSANRNVVQEYLSEATSTSNPVHADLRSLVREADSAVSAARASAGASASAEQAAALDTLSARVADLSSSLGDVEGGQFARNQYRAIVGSNEGPLADIVGKAPGMMGALVGGAPGAIIGAAAGAILDPAKAIKRIASIESVIRRVDARFDGGIKAAIVSAAKSTGAVARAAGERAASTARSGVIRGAQMADPARVYDRRRKDIEAAIADPVGRRASVEYSVRHVREQSPELADSIVAASDRATVFLANKLPQRPAAANATLTPHLDSGRIPRSELARFARYVRAVEDPSVVVRDLAAGTLSRDTVEAVREVYPAIYARVRGAVIDGLARMKSAPSYQARVKLSLLLDFTGDPSLRPEAIAASQSALTLPAAPPPTMSQGSPSKSMSENVMAQLDRLEGILV